METVLALLDAFRRGGAGAVIPTAGGRAGFPVIVGREWWGALTLRDATSVHEAVRSAVPDVRDLQIPDGAARDAAATSRAEI